MSNSRRDFKLPSPIVIRVHLAERPSLELRLEVLADEVVLTRLTVLPGDDTHRLTANAVRNLPLKKVTDEAIRQIAMLAAIGQEEPGHPYRFLSAPGDGSFGIAPGVISSRRRRLIDDELLTAVAEVVRSNPVRPNDAVHKQMHTSTRNASRWIAEAKRRGFLNEEEDNG